MQRLWCYLPTPGLRFRCYVAVLILSSVCHASLAQQHGSSVTDSAPGASSSASSASSSAYTIGVGDVLHISVWDEPQFTEKAVVRPDGKISIPLVPEVDVSGMTPEEAQQALTARLEKLVHKPRVTVVVQEIHSRMVYVTGEVMRPGAYPMLYSLNIVQLISRAGGPTDSAKTNQVYVLRNGKSEKLNVDFRKVLKGDAPEQNIHLVPGDTVVVP